MIKSNPNAVNLRPYCVYTRIPPCQNPEYLGYRQGPTEKYYQPNPKLVEFSQELDTKLSQALSRANLSSDAGIKEFIKNIEAALYDVWYKAGSDPIGKSITRMLADAHGEILHLETSYAPSDIIKNVAEIAGRVNKFLKIIAPSSANLNVPVFSQIYSDLEERDKRVELSYWQIAGLIGIGALSGVGVTLLIQGKLLAVLGTAAATLASGAVWLYNFSAEKGKQILDLVVKNILPFNYCFRKNSGNLDATKKCLVDEFKLKVEDAGIIIAVYDEGKVRGLPWATQQGILIEKVVSNPIPGATRLIPFYPLPVPYSLNLPHSLPSYDFRYFQNQFQYYRQTWEIFSCLLANKKWLKINFPEGFSLIARLDYIAPDMATGFAKRQNITISCDGKTLETKEQAQGCLNKWIQVKLPNQITLKLYLIYFDERYIGGYFATQDLLALSEKVTSIECSEAPL